MGINEWSRGREWRASGFFGHYTAHGGFGDNYVTYAEALQLVLSLAFGLFVAVWRKASLAGVLLGTSVIGMCGALFLTVTRASLSAFLLSAFVILLVGARSRRIALPAMAFALLLLVPAGLFFLQQKRNVGFFDRTDASITWRMTVYREAFELLMSNPRHLLTGVGMDSVKRFYLQWRMFDEGRLPVGHFHSTPLQIAVERGLLTLAAWLALLFIYARMLWRLARARFEEEAWIERGIILGALGGLVGFFASGLVHYNLGDSEVAMIFYFIMGLALVIERMGREKTAETDSGRTPAVALRPAA
jgi:O-antigen ligase